MKKFRSSRISMYVNKIRREEEEEEKEEEE